MVHRRAPDGGRVRIGVPEELTGLTWLGFTKVSGPGFVHSFRVGPVADLGIIDRRLLPGARVRCWRRPGYELRLYQAADDSNSALVWAGPEHGVTLWFGRPAPAEHVIGRIERLVRFRDHPDGASLTPVSRTLYHQEGTFVAAEGPDLALVVRATGDGAELPRWHGARHRAGEMWRAPLGLDAPEARRLAGTPYPWRYVIANRTAVADVVFRPPAPPAAVSPDTARMERILDGLTASWD